MFGNKTLAEIRAELRAAYGPAGERLPSSTNAEAAEVIESLRRFLEVDEVTNGQAEGKKAPPAASAGELIRRK